MTERRHNKNIRQRSIDPYDLYILTAFFIVRLYLCVHFTGAVDLRVTGCVEWARTGDCLETSYYNGSFKGSPCDTEGSSCVCFVTEALGRHSVCLNYQWHFKAYCY